jgi:hypothetical protein
MGSAGDTPRKTRHRLPKVPKYEEPNTLPLPGLTGESGEPFGSRDGHSADPGHDHDPNHIRHRRTTRLGATFLRLLGLRTKE